MGGGRSRGGGCAPPQKKNEFLPENGGFWCILGLLFTFMQKSVRSMGAGALPPLDPPLVGQENGPFSLCSVFLWLWPVCHVLKGQKNGHFPLSRRSVPDRTGRRAIFTVPSVPSCFSETASTSALALRKMAQNWIVQCKGLIVQGHARDFKAKA